MLRKLRAEGKELLARRPPPTFKEKWKRNREAAEKARAAEERPVPQLGPARRAVEDKLALLRDNPAQLLALQHRVGANTAHLPNRDVLVANWTNS
jgi:hypothetical protein